MSALRPCYECDGLGLFVCAPCEHSTYCSAACQQVDWLRSHATVCRAPTAAADPLERAPVSRAVHARMETLATSLAAQRVAFLQALGSATLVPSPLGVDLEDLPPEVFAIIARDLSMTDLRELMQTSTAWRDRYGPSIWRAMLQRDVYWLHDFWREMPEGVEITIHPQLAALLQEEERVNWRTIDADAAFNLYERVLQSTARAIARDFAMFFQYVSGVSARDNSFSLYYFEIRLVSARYLMSDAGPMTLSKFFMKTDTVPTPHFAWKLWPRTAWTPPDQRAFMDRLNRPAREDVNSALRKVMALEDKAPFSDLFAAMRDFVLYLLVHVDPSAMLQYSPGRGNLAHYQRIMRSFESAVPDRVLTSGGGVTAAKPSSSDPRVDRDKNVVFKGLATGNIRLNTYHLM